MLTMPLTNSEPNTHDARSASDNPPLVPAASTMASGPLAANRKPTSPLAACPRLTSRQNDAPRASSRSGATVP